MRRLLLAVTLMAFSAAARSDYTPPTTHTNKRFRLFLRENMFEDLRTAGERNNRCACR
jgi:hypothetical protein